MFIIGESDGIEIHCYMADYEDIIIHGTPRHFYAWGQREDAITFETLREAQLFIDEMEVNNYPTSHCMVIGL